MEEDVAEVVAAAVPPLRPQTPSISIDFHSIFFHFQWFSASFQVLRRRQRGDSEPTFSKSPRQALHKTIRLQNARIHQLQEALAELFEVFLLLKTSEKHRKMTKT